MGPTLTYADHGIAQSNLDASGHMRRRALTTQILPQTPRSILSPLHSLAGAATQLSAVPTRCAAPSSRHAPPRQTTEVGEPQPHSHDGAL
jgi:hypothetical protein